MEGDVDGAEFESLAAEHAIPMQKNRVVLYFYFQEMEVESALQLFSDAMDAEEDMITEVGHHSVAMLKSTEEDADFSEVEEYATAFENSLLTETGATVFIGISDPRKELTGIPEAFAEARAAINVGRMYHPNRRVFVYRNLLLERFLSDVSPELGANYNARIFNRRTEIGRAHV